MPLEKFCMLWDINFIEYILYHVHINGFGLLDNNFLMQLGYIYSKHQKSYTAICQLLENLIFCPN